MCLCETAAFAQVTGEEIAKWRKTAEAENGVSFGIVWEGAKSPAASGAVSLKGERIVDSKGKREFGPATAVLVEDQPKKGFDPATAVPVTDPAIIAEQNAQDDLEIARWNAKLDEDKEQRAQQNARMDKLREEAAEEERKRVDQKAAAIRDQNILYVVRIICVIGLLGMIVWKRAKLILLTRAINTPGRLNAIYLLWLFLHLMLLLFSPHPFGASKQYYESARSYGSFYPFISARDYHGNESGVYFNHVEQYDITEFLFYSLAPLVIWQAVRMWRGDSQAVRTRFPNTSSDVKATAEDAPKSSLTIDRALKIVEYAENKFAKGRQSKNAVTTFKAGGASSPLEALQALSIVIAHRFWYASVHISDKPAAMRMFDDYAGLSALIEMSLCAEATETPSIATLLSPAMTASIKAWEGLACFVPFLRTLNTESPEYWPQVYQRLGLEHA